MNCPVCDDVRMREVQKEDIMIDVCPSCKGVWLDRGELEKLQKGIQEIRQPFNEWHDDYEKKKGFNANDPKDASAIAKNGYSNIENYLNDIAMQKEKPLVAAVSGKK